MIKEEELYELISSVLAGEASIDETAELQRWIDESEDNRRQFEELEEVWFSATTEEERSRFDAEQAWDKFQSEHFAEAPQKQTIWMVPAKALRRIAAIFIPLVAVIGIAWGVYSHVGSQGMVEVATVDGESSKLHLPDGTIVNLEENSTLSYRPSDFKNGKRNIKFTGVAYFNVAKDKEHPFIIESNRVDVRVTGTSFSLSVRPDHHYDVLSLDNGRVEFMPHGENKVISLRPGDEVILNKETNLIAVRLHDVNRYGVAHNLYAEREDGFGNDRFTSGNGTKESPYVISNVKQLVHMKEVLKIRQMTYFELANDIDMTGVIWTPLNGPEDGYLNWVSLNGNNHVIRNFHTGDVQYNGVNYYSSFFGVLCGECKNIGFEDVKISSENLGVGVLGGSIGHKTFNGTTRVENCYFTGSISANSYAGAIGGSVNGKTEIRNCFTNVTVNSLSSYAGGLIGKVAASMEVHDCVIRSSISGTRAGGIVAGGQEVSTGPSVYDNVMVACSNIEGTREALPLGHFGSSDKQSNLGISLQTNVNGTTSDTYGLHNNIPDLQRMMSKVWYADRIK